MVGVGIMKEDYFNTWYQLAEFPEGPYEINKMGEIRNKHTLKKLSGSIGQSGYIAYVLTINNKAYRRLAHVMVAKQFVPNPNGYPIVNHIDENRANPCVDNLEWITYSQNSRHGTARTRSEERRSKPINEYDINGRYIRTWKSAKEIYLYYGLPYDREHRTTYLVKILSNNDIPNSEKIVFAERVYMRYTGSTDNVQFVLKPRSSLRNDMYKNLRAAQNVPDKHLINPIELNDVASEVIAEMLVKSQFLFSMKQIWALEFAIKCINMVLSENENETVFDERLL